MVLISYVSFYFYSLNEARFVALEIFRDSHGRGLYSILNKVGPTVHLRFLIRINFMKSPGSGTSFALQNNDLATGPSQYSHQWVANLQRRVDHAPL
jgi:hypothetical protein